MRNITFDESTVLNELVKIAHEKDLLKIADERSRQFFNELCNMPEFKIPCGRVSRDMSGQPHNAPANELVKMLDHYTPAELKGKLQSIYSKYDQSKQASIKSAELPLNPDTIKSNLLSKLQEKMASIWSILQRSFSSDPTEKVIQQKMLQTIKNLTTVDKAKFQAMTPAQLVNFLTAEFPMKADLINEAVTEIGGPMLLEGLSKGAGVKKAEEKKYDVTGEKGEDLINDAHPGGGTKTELDSKTDENLVETIVEQQDKDLEVAHSVPKGVLAKLIELANALDKKGYIVEANEIDSVLRKIAIDTAEYSKQVGEKFLALVLSNYGPRSSAPSAPENKIREQMNTLRGKDFFQIKNELFRIMNSNMNEPRLRGAINSGMAAVSNDVGMLADLVHKQRQQQQSAPGGAHDKDGDGVPDSVQRPAEEQKATVDKGQKKDPGAEQRKKFQNWIGAQQTGVFDAQTVQTIKGLAGGKGAEALKEWKASGAKTLSSLTNLLRPLMQPETGEGKGDAGAATKTEKPKASEISPVSTEFYESVIAPKILPQVVKLLGKDSYKDLSKGGLFRLVKYIKQTAEVVIRELGDAEYADEKSRNSALGNAIIETLNREMGVDLGSYKKHFA